jgi:hypothetical protein
LSKQVLGVLVLELELLDYWVQTNDIVSLEGKVFGICEYVLFSQLTDLGHLFLILRRCLLSCLLSLLVVIIDNLLDIVG